MFIVNTMEFSGECFAASYNLSFIGFILQIPYLVLNSTQDFSREIFTDK